MYDRILVPTDGSDCAAAAAREAFDLASALGAEVHGLSVVDLRSTYGDAGMSFDSSVLIDSLEEAGEQAIEAFADAADEAGLDAVTSTEVGVPHREILRYADEHGIDLIVMGTHGRTGLDHLLLGSVAERVVRLADVPVLTVREPAE